MNKTELPNKLTTYEIESELYNILFKSQTNEPIQKELVQSVIEKVQQLRKDIDQWRNLLFQIANGQG